MSQHMEALRSASEVRYERADIKTWVREPADTYESSCRLAAILDGPVTLSLRNLPIEEFLRWGWHSVPVRRRAARMLAGCNEMRTLGQLTERQRAIIARSLRMSLADLERARDLHEFEVMYGVAA